MKGYIKLDTLRSLLKDWCWSWNSNTLPTWCKELTDWKRPWCWERLKTEGEGDDRRRDGWMASLTQWTWVWARFWVLVKDRKPGVRQSMGSQRVRHKWAAEQRKIQNCILFLVQPLFSSGLRSIKEKEGLKLRRPSWVQGPPFLSPVSCLTFRKFQRADSSS